MESNVLLAFLLTAVAGLATGIGSLMALLAKRTNPKFLSVSLGFSAGVMVYVSFVEIFPSALQFLTLERGLKSGTILTVTGFFIGMGIIALIDQLIPHDENPHEIKDPSTFMEHHSHQLYHHSHDLIHDTGIPNAAERPHPRATAQSLPEDDLKARREAHLLRTGVFTALAIAIHNFPEGMATFMTALNNPRLAVPIVVAIAIHNIPEGISVSVPIYYATGSRRKAFRYSFLSGLAEPLGAIVGYVILMPFLNNTVQGMVNAAVAGIMVFISIDELLPSAEEYGEHHLSVLGFVGGMLLMAVSLIMFL